MPYVDQLPETAPIKVAVLGLRALFGAQGGIETHVRDIVCHAVRTRPDGVTFDILERHPYASAPDSVPADLRDRPNLRLRPIWAPRSSHFEAIAHSLLAVLDCAIRRPDIVHIHAIGPSLAAPLARLCGLRVVTTHHGTDYDRAKWGWRAKTALRLGEWCGARFSNARIVIAPGLDGALKRIHKADYTYIPNAVPPAGAPDDDVVARFGLTKGRYIVNVARIVPEKRQLELIDAFIAAGDPDTQLVLVGGADHGSGYAHSVSYRAAADPRIVMTGALPKAEVNGLYAGAKAFILPSSHEGLPISLLEAMSFGLPVAVSPLPTLVALGLPDGSYIPRTGGLNAAVAHLSSRDAATVDWTPFVQRFSIRSVTRRTLEVYRTVAGKAAAARAPAHDTAEQAVI